MKKTLRNIALVATVAGVSIAGQVVPVTQADAAPGCRPGYVCMWTGKNGTGQPYRYFRETDHSHRVASVHYNYNHKPISFWTGGNGSGARITGYTLWQRGFRNWDRRNWDRCRSHIDKFR